jgi:hypothetical protein
VRFVHNGCCANLVGQWTCWGQQPDSTYINPVLPSDYSDLDCIRVGDDFYAISSTMQFSPGTAIWDDEGRGYFLGTCFRSLSLVFRSLIRIFNQLLLLEDTLALC